MKPEQNEHLTYILSEAKKLIADKYRKGAAEHGTVLNRDHTLDEILEFQLEEAIDALTYAITAIEVRRREMEQ